MIDDVTGKDVGEHVMAFFDDGTSTPPEVSDNVTGPVAISRAPSLTATATEPADPVTAWAMAETSYRKSAAGKMGANQVGGNVMVSAPAPALSETIEVANWAMAEASYRKSAATPTGTPQPGSRSAIQSGLLPVPAPRRKEATPFAEAPFKAPVRGVNALAALRPDLKSGAVIQAAQASEAKAAIRAARQGATSLAAVNFYDAQQVVKVGTPTVRQSAQRPATPPSGAIAADGGWFSDSMLSALSKYDNGAALVGATPTRNDKPNRIDLAR